MGDLGINVPGLVTQIVSFTVLFAVLWRLLYKPVTKMLDERSSRIEDSLAAADRARAEAQSSAEQVERELAGARQEGQRLISEARDTATQYREREEARTRDELETFFERARTDIEKERQEAAEHVRRQFASIAIAAAERVIETSLDEKTHRKIIEKVLADELVQRP